MRTVQLAARFALRGRDSRLRTALTALGVGLAVAMLLLAVSVPAAFAARDARASARTPQAVDHPVPGALPLTEVGFDLEGVGGTGIVTGPAAASAPLPPGIRALPPAGSMLVSPALAAALADPAHVLLRARLPYRVAGTIPPAGLVGPSEPRFVAVDERMLHRAGAWATGFGAPVSRTPLDPVLALIVVIGVLIVLLPVGVIVTIAGRFGAERRDRRLAALRLVGLSTVQVARLAALEAAMAALLGDAVGVALFLAGRSTLSGLTVATLSVFPTDATPPIPPALIVLLLVPATAVLATLLPLRRVAVEPLGVARRATPGGRRIRWRIVPLVLAVPLIVPSIGGFRSTSGGSVLPVAAGVALLLLSALVLLPWLTERVAETFRHGSMSWTFATSRIRHSGSTSSRVTGAVVVSLAGAIALQMLFTGAGRGYSESAGVRPGERLTAVMSSGLDAGTAGRWLAAASSSGADIVTADFALRDVRGHRDLGAYVLRADCATLRRIATVHSCVDGDVFATSPEGARLAGHRLRSTTGGTRIWRVPAALRRVEAGISPGEGPVQAALLATPSALPTPGHPPASVRAVLPTASAPNLVRAVVALDPAPDVRALTAVRFSARFVGVQRGLSAGLVLVMLLISGLLVVAVGDQMRERRRTLATLAAVGTPRRVLVRSVLWEGLLPILLAVALAVVVGIALGAVLLAIISAPFAIDPGSTAFAAGLGLALPGIVTLASLPGVLQRMRPEALGTE